ncbi:MAG: N-acetyl-gamma-glutamyl-phosphate reductase [Candidatus Omnitrophota bacterium]|nr:N-acetyl-gamma-glutamyl-phosphate reductase [Candidatus Omnitrophota bacterium]
MIRVSVVGATGYTGEELVAILAKHKDVEVTSLSAIIDKPTSISGIFPALKKSMDITCKGFDIKEVIKSSDVVFLALPHRVSMQYAPEFLKAGKKVIDLSADYRLPAAVYEKWYGAKHVDPKNLKKAVYGLPELYRDKIKEASLVANPGCYPTGIILAISPLIKSGAVELSGIVIDSKSGLTGAGRTANIALLFAEISGNMKAYKIGSHQHTPEISQELKNLAGKDVSALFVPHVVPLKRGILSTMYLQPKKKLSQKEINAIYKDFYENEFFIRFYDGGCLPQVKDAVNTNFCDIGVKLTKEKIVAVSAIDNLKKGAAGQAVQNMNIMCGFDEKEGLI